MGLYCAGMFCGPPLGGLLVEITEDYYVSFVIAGVLIASGGVGLGFVEPFLEHPEHLRQLKLYEHGPPAPKAAAAVEEKAAGEGGEGAGQAGGEAGGEAAAAQQARLAKLEGSGAEPRP